MLVRALAWIAALTIATASAEAMQPPLEEGAFTRHFVERLRTAFPAQSFAISGSLQIRADNEAEINIGRVHNFCRSSTAPDCDGAITEFIAAIREGITQADLPATREQLRLAVRHQDFCDDLARRAGERQIPPEIVTRSIAPQLCAVLMIDFPTSMRSASPEDLARFSLPPDEAWQVAERQTLANLPQTRALDQLQTGMVAVTEYDYIPSMMLARDMWRDLTARHGPLIVMIPSDQMLVAVRRAAGADLAGLRRTTTETHDTALRGISPLLYTWTEGGWRELE